MCVVNNKWIFYSRGGNSIQNSIGHKYDASLSLGLLHCGRLTPPVRHIICITIFQKKKIICITKDMERPTNITRKQCKHDVIIYIQIVGLMNEIMSQRCIIRFGGKWRTWRKQLWWFWIRCSFDVRRWLPPITNVPAGGECSEKFYWVSQSPTTIKNLVDEILIVCSLLSPEWSQTQIIIDWNS
jgi:hypothetical protein